MSQDGSRQETRRAKRKNMFLSAVIDTPSGRSAARVRNLSPTGAMIESAQLPEQGSSVRLRRGSLHVSGRVAWSGGGRCGLELTSAIDVADWLSPVPNTRQAEADAIFAGYSPSPFDEPSKLTADPLDPSNFFEAADLVASLLRAVGDQLSRDPVILATRALELQAFDLAVQTLEAMASPQLNSNSDRLRNAASACEELLQALSDAGGGRSNHPKW